LSSCPFSGRLNRCCGSNSVLVVITCDGPEHRYVTNRLCEELDVAAILVTDRPARRSWKKVLAKSPARFVDKALWRIFLSVVGDEKRRTRELIRVLGERNCTSFREAHKVVKVGKPKSGELRDLVHSLKPEYLAIYGTGIIPNKVLQSVSKASLNMHTGISPFYRGTSCAFWPIYFGQPEMIGATVHECTDRVDGGKVFSRSKAQLFRHDTIHSVFARAVAAGAEDYVQVLKAAQQGTLGGEPQDASVGREFAGSMRGIIAELVVRLRLRWMRRRWPQEARS
jgi:methionyl-tRNA formyltransferase